MPGFAYTAINSQGERKVGVIDADRPDDAAKKLQKEFATIISIRPINKGEVKDKSSVFEKTMATFKKMRHHVPAQNVVFFTRQLSTMFNAGLTIEKSLGNLALNEQNEKFKKIILEMKKDVQSGRTFSDALQKHPGAFSTLYSALVKAGEMSGTLSEILDQLANYLEKNADTRQKVVSSLFYPGIIITILGLSVHSLLVFVVPRFKAVYDNFGAKLPGPTQMLIDLSNYLIDNFAMGIAAALLMILGTIAFAHSEKGERLFARAALKLPFVGNLLNSALVARFARTLGMLIRASVPIQDSFTLVAKTMGNVIIRDAVLKAKSLIQDGKSITRSLTQVKVFPNILLQLVDTGEETGEIDSLLIKCAEYYEKQIDAMVNRITSILSPILIVLLGIIVLIIVVAIYLPIFYLGSAIRHGV